MAILDFFELQKLKIQSWEKDRSKVIGEFKVMFNPESYSRRLNNNYGGSSTLAKSKTEKEYLHSSAETINMKLVFDGNKVHLDGIDALAGMIFGSDTVHDQVEDFLEKTTHYDGGIHEPRPLTLFWGKLDFNCRVASVNINYTQFNKSGTPLRAEVDVSFIYDDLKKATDKIENRSSPDLTHYRIVKAHDQLPLMCKEIYGSPKYYVYVAKANGLDDFRNLEPGQEIFFPPVNK